MSEEEKFDAEQKSEMIHKHIRALAEHFDCVQVFCSCHLGDSKGTRAFAIGSGNYYGRYGQIREWIVKKEEQSRCEMRDDLRGDS